MSLVGAGASIVARGVGVLAGECPMNETHLLSLHLCGEIAATSLALLLALACRVAEAATRRGSDAATTADARIREEAPDCPAAVLLGRP
jgi:hypothetical protein